jgi:hypothetical protein
VRTPVLPSPRFQCREDEDEHHFGRAALSLLLLQVKLGDMRDTLSIYFTKDKVDLRKRLERLAKKRDRSINYIVLKAIEAYLKREQQE